MPVSLAISDAVIGWLPCSAARILAWFWPRGAVARLAARERFGRALPRGSLGWLGRGYRLAAEARPDRALKVLHRVAQAPELIGNPLVLGDLILDLLEPLYDLLGDRADIRTLWHLAPALELPGIVVERPPGT